MWWLAAAGAKGHHLAFSLQQMGSLGNNVAIQLSSALVMKASLVAVQKQLWSCQLLPCDSWRPAVRCLPLKHHRSDVWVLLQDIYKTYNPDGHVSVHIWLIVFA
jgi:hypothetical protein